MVLLFCIFHHQVATAAGLNITTEYCHIVWLSYNCYRCHFPEGRNFLRFFAKSPHPNLYVPNSFIIYPMTCQKSPKKNTHLSIDLSFTIRVFWSRHLAGPPGRFAVCPWRNGIPQVSIWFEKGAAKRQNTPGKVFN